MSLSIADLWRALQKRGRADYLVLPDRTLSFAAMRDLVGRWFTQFDSLGLAEGDRLVIRTDNEVAAISVWLAAVLDGVVPVMVTSQTPDARLLAIADMSEAAALVTDADPAAAPLPAAIGQVVIAVPEPAGRSLFGMRRQADAVPGLAGEVAKREPRLPTDASGLAYLLFTSGTTSSPAGVMISRGNLCANLQTLGRVFGYDSQSRIFNDMILAHADGMIQGPVLALANGGAVIRSGGFQLSTMESWLNRVRQERATHVITVPTVWAMIDAYAAHDDYFDAPECRSLLSVAAKLADPLWDRLESRFKRPLFNQYGLTETVASATYAGPHPEMGARFTIGKPIDCEARIDGGAGDGPGELQLRGDNIFPGYWRNPERTSASFTDDGWLKTGDLCQRTADGNLLILGRIKSVIMTGGFLIRPDEIDEAMVRHPAVRESATVGMDDEFFGEVPVTAVVTDSPTDELALIAHARASLESQKVPKRIIVLDAIPRGDAGKVKLGPLRDLLAIALNPADATAQAPDGGSLEAQVIAVAADVFRVDAAMLNLKSRQGSIAGWDSFSQLNLVMAVEAHFDIAIPASRIAAIRDLGDMVATVEALRS